MDKTKKQQLPFATWVRASSAVMILACHYVEQSNHASMRMLGQFLNIGVYLFFILSGFLAGYRGIAKPCGTWYRKRLKRIFIPFWVFLVVLAIVHTTKGLDVLTTDWLLLVLGLQGSVVGVWGAEQTWFISVLLLCYLITPIISAAIARVSGSDKMDARIACLVLISLMPVANALFEAPWVYTILTPVSFYTIAFLAGCNYDPKKRVSKRLLWACVCIIIGAFSLRLMVRALFDGSILYDRIAVPYTQFFAAGAMFYLAAALLGNRQVPLPVKFISDISFEVYLYHYMFTVGPISLFGCTPSWLTDCIATSGIVIVISFCFSKLTGIISKHISAR